MRIAIDCRLIGQSGIGTFIENVVRHSIDMLGVDFVLIGCRTALSAYEERSNCSIVECDYGSFTLKELFRFPTREVNRCDAFFTPNFNIPFGIKVPVFCTIHDVVFFDVDGICSPVGKVIRWAYIKRALGISSTVFTVSDFSKRRIKSLFHYKKAIPVVYNGITQELIDYRKNHGGTGKGNYIVCLGNLKKYKGVKMLISAYNMAKERGAIDDDLVIIGRIDFRTKDEELVQLIKKQDKHIRFVTDADNARVYQLLSEAKALISPSNYEGFGIPPLEAMYLHTPALVSDIPTHREIYKDSPATFFKAGDLEDLAGSLSHLPSDACDIDELVSHRYSYQIAAKQILETIHAQLSIC